MGFATSVAVNSDFTRRVVHHTWPWLTNSASLRVIHPCVSPAAAVDGASSKGSTDPGQEDMWPGEKIVLSINRFERKKDIGLAIRAFSAIPPTKRKSARLVIAGMYSFHIFVSTHRKTEKIKTK